jgi:hypothetical protein
MWPIHFKHSHWWKGGANPSSLHKVCECKIDAKSTWIPTWHPMDLVSWSLELFCHMWEPTWIDIYWNSIWLRVRSHMTSLYTWGSMTTLHDCGGVLGWPLDTFFGLSQFHGHGSWLVCEVALIYFKALLPCGGLWTRPTHHTSLCYGWEKWAKLVHKLKKI